MRIIFILAIVIATPLVAGVPVLNPAFLAKYIPPVITPVSVDTSDWGESFKSSNSSYGGSYRVTKFPGRVFLCVEYDDAESSWVAISYSHSQFGYISLIRGLEQWFYDPTTGLQYRKDLRYERCEDPIPETVAMTEFARAVIYRLGP